MGYCGEYEKCNSREISRHLLSFSILFCSPGTGQFFFFSQVLIPSMGRITP